MLSSLKENRVSTFLRNMSNQENTTLGPEQEGCSHVNHCFISGSGRSLTEYCCLVYVYNILDTVLWVQTSGGQVVFIFYDRYLQEHCGPNNMCYIAHFDLIMIREKDCQIWLADEWLSWEATHLLLFMTQTWVLCVILIYQSLLVLDLMMTVLLSNKHNPTRMSVVVSVLNSIKIEFMLT